MLWYGLTVSEKREIHPLLIYLSSLWLCTRSIFFISKWSLFSPQVRRAMSNTYDMVSMDTVYHLGKVKTRYMFEITCGTEGWNQLQSKKMLFMQRTPLFLPFLPFQPLRLHCFLGIRKTNTLSFNRLGDYIPTQMNSITHHNRSEAESTVTLQRGKGHFGRWARAWPRHGNSEVPKVHREMLNKKIYSAKSMTK